MTTVCLQDDALLAVYLGEAPAADARHATTCPRCTGRLGTLRDDLARIDRHLALPPPPAHSERSLGAFAWVPFALAAAAVLAVVLLRPHADVPTPAAPYDPDVVVFLGDVANALDPLNGGADDALEPLDALGEADEQSRADPPVAPIRLALGGRSTHGLDESFIGVGCTDSTPRG